MVLLFILVLVGVMVLLKAALIFCVAPGKMTFEAKKTARIFFGLNCAHRGLHTENQQVAENSVSAFAAARKSNYGAEIDVQLSKDGKVVVFHDDNLKRVCGVDKRVCSMNWQELSELALFKTGERIALLSEVVEILGEMPVIVEIKSAGANNSRLCSETLKIMRSGGINWCMESFDPRICAWFRKNAPDVLRGQLSCRPRDFEGIPKPYAFLLGNLFCNFMSRPHFVAYRDYSRRPMLVCLCHAMKPMRVVWTVRPDSDIERCEKENDAVIFEYYEPKPRYK